MSAFGQAGFGSRNRRNQLRSQGQMDPYGQQVRAAKQAPTFNVYQTQGTQQAAGQQQAQSQSQPTQQSAAAQPSLQLGAPAMPAYGQPAAPIAGSAQGGPGTAQPIQPQSQGTPYGADPGYADRVAAAAQQWNSTPAGSQKRDWEGNTVRGMLAGGLPLDMAARVLETNSTRYSGNPAGASQFASEVQANDLSALLAGGPPPPPGPGSTAAEHSAYSMDASGNLVPYGTSPQSMSGQAQPIQPQTQGTSYRPSERVTHYIDPQASSEAALRQMAKEQTYQQSVNQIRGRVNAANAGLLGRYLGDGKYEYDYMLQGYGGDIDPANISFSLVGSPKR